MLLPSEHRPLLARPSQLGEAAAICGERTVASDMKLHNDRQETWRNRFARLVVHVNGDLPCPAISPPLSFRSLGHPQTNSSLYQFQANTSDVRLIPSGNDTRNHNLVLGVWRIWLPALPLALLLSFVPNISLGPCLALRVAGSFLDTL